ncbi:hypothetical protein E5288_WYG003941 [Bos mutus]|uniref:Uncharacterized protein n=1 Tax=Bos mutus TaxID=72004 RepID=A0A6B0S656_9CETA|nr:hypothetical protein [Bos mutus]
MTALLSCLPLVNFIRLIQNKDYLSKAICRLRSYTEHHGMPDTAACVKLRSSKDVYRKMLKDVSVIIFGSENVHGQERTGCRAGRRQRRSGRTLPSTAERAPSLREPGPTDLKGTGGCDWRQIPPPPPIRCDQGTVPADVEDEPVAVQVMIGLINGALGRIWLLFYTRQFEELSVEYKPIALLSGYPFWTFLFFIISGVLTIQTEKKRSPNLVLTLFRRAGLWEGENQQTVECEEQGRVIKKIPNGKVRFVTVYASTTTDASGTGEIWFYSPPTLCQLNDYQ